MGLKALGYVVFFGGLMKFLGSHQPWWMTLSLIGLFMVAIRIPRVYPKKVFVFDRGDMILPTFYTTIFLIVVDARLVQRVLWAVGFFVISLGVRPLINLSDRFGSRIAGGRTLADE